MWNVYRRWHHHRWVSLCHRCVDYGGPEQTNQTLVSTWPTGHTLQLGGVGHPGVFTRCHWILHISPLRVDWKKKRRNKIPWTRFKENDIHQWRCCHGDQTLNSSCFTVGVWFTWTSDDEFESDKRNETFMRNMNHLFFNSVTLWHHNIVLHRPFKDQINLSRKWQRVRAGNCSWTKSNFMQNQQDEQKRQTVCLYGDDCLLSLGGAIFSATPPHDSSPT